MPLGWSHFASSLHTLSRALSTTHTQPRRLSAARRQIPPQSREPGLRAPQRLWPQVVHNASLCDSSGKNSPGLAVCFAVAPLTRAGHRGVCTGLFSKTALAPVSRLLTATHHGEDGSYFKKRKSWIHHLIERDGRPAAGNGISHVSAEDEKSSA